MLINYVCKKISWKSIVSSSHTIKYFASLHLNCKKCFQFNIYFMKVLVFCSENCSIKKQIQTKCIS